MNLIACVDDNMGLLFNHRRLSRDRLLVDNVMFLIGTNKLFIYPFSIDLFKEKEQKSIVVSDCALDQAGANDFCFIEDRGASEYINSINKLVLYRWNRRYPSDLKLDIDVEKDGFTLFESREFAGTSHEMITRDIFIKSKQ